MYLIGNKLDLNNQRKVQYQDGQKVKRKNLIALNNLFLIITFVFIKACF